MSTTIDFTIKQCFDVLSQDNRWNVLTVLILHANIRNRCWPSVDTIARLATNGNKKVAIRARKWLEDHGAVELVPYEKRIPHEEATKDETKLHPSRKVYQLTGTITLTDKDGKRTVHSYLYTNRNSVDSTISPETISPETIVDLDPQSIYIDSSSKTSTKSKSSSKQNDAAVLEIFDAKVAQELLEKYGLEKIEKAHRKALAIKAENPPGWIRSALEDGYNLDMPKKHNGKKAGNIEDDGMRFKRSFEKYGIPVDDELEIEGE